MRQIKKETFYKITKQILMSVYWAMYYFEELEKSKKAKESKQRNKNKTKKIKFTNNLKPIIEKKKNDK